MNQVKPNAKLVTMARAYISLRNSKRKNERGCPCLDLATTIIAMLKRINAMPIATGVSPQVGISG